MVATPHRMIPGALLIFVLSLGSLVWPEPVRGQALMSFGPAPTLFDAPAEGAASGPTEPLPGFAPGPFLRVQLSTPRVNRAAERSEQSARAMFRAAGLEYPATDLYLRAFKHEGLLELWARNPGERRYRLVTTYSMCATSGTLGPKERLGDRQIPEGFYTINGFNPFSEYHLSVRVDYPNRRDLARGAGRPGGDIFIHGGCATVGCIPLEDEPIEELYWVLARARDLGGGEVPLHIFPARMSGPQSRVLRTLEEKRPDLEQFWAELRPAYDFFEVTRELPRVQVGRRYTLDIGAAAGPANRGPLGRELP